MTDKIHWDAVERAVAKGQAFGRAIAFGPPYIANARTSVFADVDVQPRWSIPEAMIVSQTINGGFFTKLDTPYIPISPDEIRTAALECAENAPTTLHVHMRGPNGVTSMDPELYRQVLQPVKDRYPSPAYDGCLVATNEQEQEDIRTILSERILEVTPVNTTASYCGDVLFTQKFLQR